MRTFEARLRPFKPGNTGSARRARPADGAVPSALSDGPGSRIVGPAMGLSPGTRFGPYQIVAPLGAGGMGEVYRARDTRLQREVAPKILPQAVAQDPARRPPPEREARAGA